MLKKHFKGTSLCLTDDDRRLRPMDKMSNSSFLYAERSAILRTRDIFISQKLNAFLQRHVG